ncbi:NAD(+) synthase [Caproicibacterium sp. NSD3]
MKDGFLNVAAVTPALRVADCDGNAEKILEQLNLCTQKGISVAVFPELSLTGYTCGDLFHDVALLRSAEENLKMVIQKSSSLSILAAVGVPVAVGGALYNCAAVFCKGKLLGLTAKKFIPNYGEFYEMRQFTPAPEEPMTVSYCDTEVPLGSGLLYQCENNPQMTVGVEICEDLWVPEPPSVQMAREGALLILNLSASDETIGKAEYRDSLVGNQSARLYCAYAYADAGEGESTTDMVFAGHDLIAESGAILCQTKLFSGACAMAQVDLERLLQERRRATTWTNLPPKKSKILFSMNSAETGLLRQFSQTPFVPEDQGDLKCRCELILSIQANGLKTRLKHTGIKNVVIGVSGGLDSTLALLVATRAFELLGLSKKGILAVSMPGFGTTSRTRSNAEGLAVALGAQFKEVPIGKAVRQHFSDIGHDESVQDVTYENSQARERTQVLMDLANQVNGLVIGTGDLSELALGWATYNGDHMSMYGVNASIPKTLVRHLVRYAAEDFGGEIGKILLDVLDTPVSPELLPPKDGKIAQKTENLVGPYELHDFFLYYMLRFGFAPDKIYRMACHAFEGQYDHETILKWLKTFYRRFFTQQFKRSCLPDAPKVGSVTLSPRGDWRMPSDAAVTLWMKILSSLES